MHSEIVLKSSGRCPTCDQDVTFVAKNAWLRDHFLCSNCGSIPRERSLMHVIETWYPHWRGLTIHESSPGHRGASVKLAKECSGYIPSQYFPDQLAGKMVNGIRCENLEALSFQDSSIDLHISQDVMEHIFHPSKAFCEIARTLKPGGAHIFTVPLVNKHNPSKARAQINSMGEITHLHAPVYHGNPINNEGSLVTVDWGFDICQHIFNASGLFTHMIYIDDFSKGIRAELIEVLATIKPMIKSSSAL